MSAHKHQQLSQGAGGDEEPNETQLPPSKQQAGPTDHSWLEQLPEPSLDAAITELATICQPAEAGHRRGMVVSSALGHSKVLVSLFGKSSDRGEQCSMVRSRLLAVKRRATWSFVLLFWTGLMSNFDTGVLIAGILDISQSMGLNHGAQGSLIGIVYFGIFLATMPAALLMESSPTGQRLIVATAMLCNCVFNMLFAAGQDFWQLMVLRVGVGATQAVLTVYAPVWIDYFGAVYMPLFQASAPLGIVAGYLTTGFTLRNLPKLDWVYMWRWPFVIQSVLLLLVSIFLFAIGDRAFNVPRPQDTFPGFNMGDNSSLYLQFLLNPSNHRKRKLKRYGASCAAYTCISPLRDELTLLRIDFSDPFWEGQLKPQRTGLNCFSPLGPATNPADALDNVDMMVKCFKEGHLGEYQGYFEHQNAVCKYLVFNGTIGDDSTQEEPPQPARNSSGIGPRLCVLMTDGVFVSFVGCLTFLYFVVTGIQSWVTEYLVAELHAPFETVVAVFGATAITAPVCGVLTCATVVDRFIGGYQNYPEQTTWFALLMATAAVASAIACCLVTDFWHLSYLIWLLLFFGGSIVPAATGIFQEPADKVGREFANAFAQVIFSIFGYMGAPVITGWTMEAFGRKTGMHLVFLTSVLSWIFLVLGLLALKRQRAHKTTLDGRTFEQMSPDSLASEEVSPLAVNAGLDLSGLPALSPTLHSPRKRSMRFVVPTAGATLFSGLPHEVSPKHGPSLTQDIAQEIEISLEEV